MGQHKKDADAVARAISDNELTLLGERVAVLRDEAEETFDADGVTLYKAESYKRAPLSGVVVAVGADIDHDLAVDLLGSSVHFNRYQVSQFELDMEPFEQPITLDVLSIRDLFWKGAK